MSASQSHYVMIERKYGNQSSSWYPAWEATSDAEAQSALKSIPALYGEVSRCVIVGKPSGDCREHRPC